MDLIIWLFIALGILILSIIVLSKGVSQRVTKPSEKLQQQITQLEERVRNLEEQKK